MGVNWSYLGEVLPFGRSNERLRVIHSATGMRMSMGAPES